MSDYEKIIDSAFATTVSEKPIRVLFNDIKKIHSDFKKRYKQIVYSSPKNSAHQVLYDNFYMVEKFCKLLQKENPRIRMSVNAENIPLIGYVMFYSCCDSEIPKTEVAVATLKLLAKKKYITNTELEYLVWSFRFTLLKKLFEVFKNDESNGQSALELIILLSKSDTFDLRRITSECNPLEVILNREKSGIYQQMDEQTKRQYRNKTSAIAVSQKLKEQKTAQEYIKNADRAFEEKKSEREVHVGFYIFEQYSKIFKRISPKGYVAGIATLSAIFSVVSSYLLGNYFIWILLFFPFWMVGKEIIESIFTRKNQITYLPRMDFKSKIPDNAKTLIVVSTLIDNPKDMIKLKTKLIRLYFSNNSDNLKICALCDLRQADSPDLPVDDAILRNATRLINKLNEKYCDKFIIIIRKRSFSKTQQKYTGFERKRGAIEQLIKFIKNESVDFLSVLGDKSFVKQTKYICALDYDTKALMDTVAELVSIAGHPLNKPEIIDGAVRSGYGIIMPRITTKLKSSLKSPFSKLVGGIGSSCAYDTLCADIYQDTFSESIFSGKGLIDTDVYYKLCSNFFPDERILSHDILEGSLMRTAFAGDIEFSDGFPSTAISYFKRLHRWIRGDFQNAQYISNKIIIGENEAKNPFGFLDKFKLFDNLRRSSLSINVLILFATTFFLKEKIAFAVSIIAITCLMYPYISAFIQSIIRNGFYSLSRKYYSGMISQTTENLSQAFFSLLLLPQQAVISLDAMTRALWRTFVSHKNLLEWTTAQQTEKNSSGILSKARFYLFSELISIALLFSPCVVVRALSAIYVLVPIIISYADKPYSEKVSKRSAEKTESLLSDLSAMWQFYEDYASKDDNYLPPDNVQFAPVFRICHRTSPTNIGLMMLSILVARDFDLIDSNGLFKRVERTLSSVEKLETFKGNLYNWYETKTLTLSCNPYVSAVDSGNFLCCMVALKEGLKEYHTEHSGITDLIERINKIIDDTDLSFFYDDTKELLVIGYNATSKEFSKNHYDLLMSEARMTSYLAIAKRQIPKKHWKVLGRTMARSGHYAGPVSYSGTMFEFFMPELLLESEKGSLSYEGLEFCLFCQKKRARLENVPFGISESGFYAFDNALNYQYKAHGVQKNGLKRGLDSELVVSPYSTYLVLGHDFDGAFDNLCELKKLGMYGSYGFYEAIDFTASRAQNGGAIIKSYMAHHIGMSIVSLSNSLKDNCMKKRFFEDCFMKSADELLQEKIMPGAVMFEDIIKKYTVKKSVNSEEETEYFESFCPSQPNVKLLCNGEYTLALTDIGASIAIYQGADVYLRTTDILRRPNGCFFAVRDGKSHASFTYLPEYKNFEEMSVEFGGNTVSYYRNTDELNLGMKVHLHNNLPCELRQFAFKNISTKSKKIDLLSYIEPVLSAYSDHNAHPAFSKLFLEMNYDIENKSVIISRKNRHDDSKIFCAIGFIENVDLLCNLSREDVLSRHDGIQRVFFETDRLISNLNSVADPCVFLKTEISLEPNEHKELTLFILTALKQSDLMRNISSLRMQKHIEAMSSFVISVDSLEGRIANSILPQIFFKKRDCTPISTAIENNHLPARELWRFGISGDLPIILVELTNINDKERIIGYAKCHRILRLSGIKTDLVFLFNDKGEYARNYFTMINDILTELSQTESIATFGGIHLIDSVGLDDAQKTLLLAIAVHLAPLSLVRIGLPAQEFTPIEIIPVERVSFTPENRVIGGGYHKNSFIITDKPAVPWCTVLANPVFGTMVSDSSLGFSYAINSHENKLTPWFNDTQSDNRGEMLLIRINEKVYDAVLGSTAVFSEEKVEFHGKCDEFTSKVTVGVSKSGMCKKVELEIYWHTASQNSEIAFYTEPVLGVNRDNSRMLIFSKNNNSLVIHNPLNDTVSGFMAISCCEKNKILITNREHFLRGNWLENSLSLSNDPCASVVVPTQCELNKKQSFVFYLSFGRTLDSALEMPNLFKPYFRENKNEIEIQTPDKLLDNAFNHWLDWQTLGGRIYARTGFYQNSGAWGFRDQLQDSCASLLLNPLIAKRQIARACTAQFPEGDVLHWWHKLPNMVMRGVRTRYSDDLVWLPYTLCEYIDKTGDLSILGIDIAYCDGISLNEDQHEIYGEVVKSSVIESVYNHCKRALNRAYRIGERGLILMGCGDWNDSFNGVGIGGRGESVWLSEFMIIVMRRFAKIAEKIGDIEIRDDCIAKAHALTSAVEENCWDGEWYLRAFFDNGDELGSRNSPACQIDSLAQSFAIMAQLPNVERNLIALSSANSMLVDWKNQLIKLFAPPFSNNEMPVGYAASYPAGIRENGGQYTHGAIWLAIANFEAGYYEKGYKMLKLLNPAEKYLNQIIAHNFRNEPFYMSADIYTNNQCYGRGGWSIYTGAAAWYYRTIFENLLGIKIKGNAIFITPNLPIEWNEMEVSLKYYETRIHITIVRGLNFGIFDNDKKCEFIPIDGKTHEVRAVVAKEDD